MTGLTRVAHGIEVADGVVLHAIEWRPAAAAGTGRPDLLLVHGLASNAQLWTGLAELLAIRGHRVVAVDQRGHGLSAKVDDGYDFGTLTNDLVAVLDALRLDRPIAFGQSWGGNVVVELAARRPDRVRGLVCIDGGQIELAEAFDDRESMLAALRPPPLAGMRLADLEAGMGQRLASWPATGVQGQLANFVRRPDGTVRPHLTLERHLAILEHLWEHRPSSRFPELDLPALLLPVRGTPAGGGVTKRSAIEAAERLLPRSRTHWFDGSHDIHAEDPAAVLAVLVAAEDEHFFDDH